MSQKTKTVSSEPPQTLFYVDANGVYLGGYAGAEPPNGAIEVSSPPEDARQIWDGGSGEWLPVPAPIIESVTARQFKMQLVIGGIKAQVDAWIASQDEVVQVAYEYSGTFVRSEPMMKAGFEALGFTAKQLDDFFIAASKL
jgi:hypothetical protein